MKDIIKIRDLVKRFGEFSAVQGISLDVKEGEVFAFLGPNGAGKSTTIKMITTLLHPTSGSITVGGFDPIAESEEVRRSIGIVFQDPSLDDDLTAEENMEFHAMLYGVPSQERKSRIDRLFELVDLSDRKKNLVREYSGGMKRRLEIARALIHEPKILFLDEPTLGLDPQTRNHMWSYVSNLNKEKGMTIFFTTHYMEEAARNADRIAIIDQGKIVSLGTPKEIVEKSGKENLEDAFIELTGHMIREEGAGELDALRAGAKMWRRR